MTLFANTPDAAGAHDVSWRPLQQFQAFAGQVPHDVTIVQRDPSLCGQAFASRLTVLWVHDLALRRNAKDFLGTLWNVDVMAVLSRYHLEQYKEVLGLPEPPLWQTRNGIDLSLFPKPAVHRDKDLMVYVARPERGLDRLLMDIWPRIRVRIPTAKLLIGSYDNPVEHLRSFYGELRYIADQYQGSVEYIGCLAKRQLYELYGRAGLYLYPTPSPRMPDFGEVSCLTAMECQAMGLPIVTSNLGALPETIALGAGTLIEPGDNYADRFVQEVVRLRDSPSSWLAASHAGQDVAQALSWDVVAREWLEMFESKRKEHNDDQARLARHFARRSDIIACREIGDRVPAETAEWIDREFSFIDDPQTARRHYELIGKTHTDSYESAGHEPRLQELIRWMGAHEDITEVLDVGCAQGCYAVHMSNAHERLRIMGVDHDRHSIEWAVRYQEQHARHKGNLLFVLDNSGMLGSGEIPSFDCLILCETLEHVKEPWALVDQYEKYVRPGGWVYITVPRGPWEHMSYRTYPYRCHVWEFDHHDLADMFGKKKNVSVAYMANGKSNLTGDPIGWHVITYQVTEQPSGYAIEAGRMSPLDVIDGVGRTGTIDMARKLAYQRPRQSISAAIIAGPGVEDTVGWCLNPLRDVVDEIVVADNGLTDAALTILHMAGAKVVEGANPMQEGFDVSRNKALDACSSDWILWVDTDERLVYPDRLSKYLRHNHWHGYGLRQHHFAVDTRFEPDMPVRLFRRAPRDGKTMRHYGCVTPDTLVTTNPGLAEISSVQPGQFVRTHDGSYGMVDKVWKYDIEDEILELLAVGMPVPLRITKDHKLYVIPTEKCHYDHDYNVRCKPICRKAPECPHRFFEHYVPEWKAAKDVEVGDLLMYPIDSTVARRHFIQLSDHAKEDWKRPNTTAISWRLSESVWRYRKEDRSISDKLAVNDDLLRLAGYYVSDGSIAAAGKISFYFASHEASFIEDVRGIAIRLGLFPIVKPHPHSAMQIIKVSCKPLAQWLIGEFGRGSREKKAPLWVMRLPPSQQEQFLTGIWRGDGNVSGSLVRYATVCRDLAFQVQDLLLRQEIMANVRWGKASSTYEVFARIKRRRFLDWDMPDDGAHVPTQSWTDGCYAYMRVKSVASVPYKGTVYDLRVPGNHSFVFGRVAGANSIHEHPELELNSGPGPIVVLSDIHIAHIGYLDEEGCQRRYWRNLPLLEMDIAKNPDRLIQKHFLCRDKVLMARYILSANGGQLTEQVRALCEDTVELYRKYFMGKPGYVNINSLQYYSEALKFLGRGIDVEMTLVAEPPGKLNGSATRFETEEDLRAELDWRVKDTVTPLLGKYY